jgi:MoaA/NifB/PqqE/SkfB family radical SAM enzyme
MKDIKMLAALTGRILKSKITGKRVPLFLSLFITNRCNLRCKYCFIVDETLGKEVLNAEYDKKELFEIIDEFYTLGTRMIFMLGGEPLMHPDIGAIIDYIVNKGIYLHVITNGTLIEKRIEEIKRAHVLCVSLDGLGEVNDIMRGKGCYERAVAGIKAGVKAGIPTRIHAVLTRRNLHKIPELAGLSKELRAPLSISPPNYLGVTDIVDLQISQSEYKTFWSQYLDLACQGYPIANTQDAIKMCLNWPKDYHTYIRRGERFPEYKPIFCLNGYTYAALSADKVMYNCINTECRGPSIKDMSISRAWETLLDWRPDCVSCSSINCIETAMLLNLRKEILFSGIRLHRSMG